MPHSRSVCCAPTDDNITNLMESHRGRYLHFYGEIQPTNKPGGNSLSRIKPVGGDCPEEGCAGAKQRGTWARPDRARIYPGACPVPYLFPTWGPGGGPGLPLVGGLVCPTRGSRGSTQEIPRNHPPGAPSGLRGVQKGTFLQATTWGARRTAAVCGRTRGQIANSHV